MVDDPNIPGMMRLCDLQPPQYPSEKPGPFTHRFLGRDRKKSASLASLEGLDSLYSVGSRLFIGRNPALTDLEGLNNLTSVWGLTISDNQSLTRLEGLEGLTSVESRLFIGQNPALTSLEGLNNLTSVGGDLSIVDNPVLPTSSAQALADRLVTGGFTGEITIENNQP